MKDGRLPEQSSITSLLMFGVLSATLIYTCIFSSIVFYQVDSPLLTESFMRRVSIFGIPFLFLLMIVIAMTIKLIMSPIAKAMKQIQMVSFDKPGIRLDDAMFPHEIRPMAHAINEALERLEKGIVAQRDFIASAAHELRTPLSILRSQVDLLPDKGISEKMRADVDTMARLVNQLLDTARLESPEKLDMHMINLTEAVKSVSQTLWPLMVKDGRTFEVFGIERPVQIYGNFDSICRALRNLLENTLKHTPHGSPITVSMNEKCIKVTDSGGGIPLSEREKIFGKFSRRDMQKGSGAGLGLFIVRRIMELHGGRVDVDDAPGGGAVFTLTFPEKQNLP